MSADRRDLAEEGVPGPRDLAVGVDRAELGVQAEQAETLVERLDFLARAGEPGDKRVAAEEARSAEAVAADFFGSR
jgi:hypothetical protein